MLWMALIAEWIAFTWRFDSGPVVSGIPDAGFAISVTPNQQATIGLACNGVLATVKNPISDWVGPGGKQGVVTSKLLTLPQGGYDNFPSAENDDHNRIASNRGTYWISVLEQITYSTPKSGRE